MKLLELSLPSPAGNLACDEALLNRGEAGGGEVLRFWEPREYFVVVGYANQVETEVNVPACAAKKIPIFRRCSGGGTVLQGPGCLNYTLILQITGNPLLANISCANKFIMGRNREAVQSAMGPALQQQSAVSVCGHTDLALVTRHSPSIATHESRSGDGPSPSNLRGRAVPAPVHGPDGHPILEVEAPRKFSGNSQRRHKHALLFHGTFLLNFDLPLVNELLRMPSKQPDYRNHRGHAEFLTNLNVPAIRLKHALQAAWGANEEMRAFPDPEMRRLAMEKYSTPQWNFKS